MQFSIVIAVGPSPSEVHRLQDILDGVRRHERSSIHECILIDDGRGALPLASFSDEHPFVRVLPSFREGKGDSWRGGLSTNIVNGISHAFREPEVSFVVKLDTDSLVVAPFSEQISRAMRMLPRVGIFGSCYRFDPAGCKVPASTWQRNLHKLARLWRFRRNPIPHLEFALWGRRRTVRRLIVRALQRGWALGSCAQGGGYAVTRQLFEQCAELNRSSDTQLWRDFELTEDVVMSMLCYASGMEVKDLNQPNEPFGVVYKGLAAPPDDLIRRNYSIIHSTKCESWAAESALRSKLTMTGTAAS